MTLDLTTSLQIKNYGTWRVVEIIQRVIFTVLLFSFVSVSLFHMRKMKKVKKLVIFLISICLYISFKIDESLLSLILLSNYNDGKKPEPHLFISIYILDTIGLRFFFYCISTLTTRLLKRQDHSQLVTKVNRLNVNTVRAFYYDETMRSETKVNSTPKEDSKNKQLSVILFWIIASISIIATFLNIIGSCVALNNQVTSTCLLQVSSVLFLIDIIVVILILFYIMINFISKGSSESRTSTILLMITSFSILIKCSNFVISSWGGLDLENLNKYMFLYGDYVYYTYSALMPEIFGTILILVEYSRWYNCC
ncbi:hypothetical protein KGF54_004777 [Candida jiufengensis]|uniref:uncharacterized protein n=1 Tax=Candida jiufengensis TaxID=497108 RepID=UPI0022243FF7|nr:uncharacterized protein KGF54_004777 [Candida jiufengensis]KAI5951702.1 hypothetical protein KGF54_004777 [Candida jiufengensis]